MALLSTFIAILITIFILMFGQYNDSMLNVSIMYTNASFQASFLVLSLVIFSFGILTGVFLMLSTFFDIQGRYSKLKNQYNKTSIGQDNADEKIKLLENKIETLEAALKKQLGQ